MLLDQVVWSNHLSAPCCCVSAATWADMFRYLREKRNKSIHVLGMHLDCSKSFVRRVFTPA